MENNCFSWLIIVYIIMLFGNENVEVSRVYSSPGETYPATVEVAIGSDFNISCYMNRRAFPGKNSSHLYFVNGRTGEQVAKEYISIINNTSVMLTIRNANEQQTEYRCKCGTDAIMETKVFVGSPPKPVKDFACRSYDFEYMVCNFSKPSNPVLTQYNVTFYIDSAEYQYQPECSYDGRSRVVCNTSLANNYRPRVELYHYIINARNSLAKMIRPQQFEINNWEIMVPSKPGEDLRIEELSVNGLTVAWRMPKWEDYRKSLKWEIIVQPENATALELPGPERTHGFLRLQITNLPYAYWHYQLKIRVRVKAPDAIWSEQFIFPFRTLARKPDRPPLIKPGSFYVDSQETRVTIYWEELSPYEYNGDNFTYTVTEVRRGGKIIDLRPLQQDINLVTFIWNKFAQYEFEIRSRNHMGTSDEGSRLTIYALGQRNTKRYEPRAVHNVYHADNRTYTLSWSKPLITEGLENYTVYWCYPKRALSNECKGSMHFQQVPSEQLNFTTDVQNALQEHTLNLAVSADYEDFNTGLHWTDCTMDVNSDLVKMDPEVMAISATSITVHWSVERVCTSILDGFNLTYCEVSKGEMSAENSTCLQKPISKIIHKSAKKDEIGDLKPFTSYKVNMLMYSRLKKGKISDAQLIRTLEGTPSPPRQLQVTGVTNTSATISWQPPSQPNGHIRKYTIILNTDKYEVDSSVLEYKLPNLTSFTAYKVYVLAHTVNTSMPSNDVHFTTLIGYPSPPGHATTTNNSIIQWTRPQKPRGHIEFYEVAVTQMRNDVVIKRRLSIVIGSETACAFKVPPCLGPEYKTLVEVRAVNVAPRNLESTAATAAAAAAESTNKEEGGSYDIEEGSDELSCVSSSLSERNLKDLKRYNENRKYELYKSDWQNTATYTCSSSRLSKITTIALLVVAMSLGIMFALYMARKKYNKMANINCTLPASLETYFSKEGQPATLNSSGNYANNAGGRVKGLDITFQRSVEEQWINSNRMHEFNIRNEHHHLLSSLGSESGYLAAEGGVLSTSLETRNIEDDQHEREIGMTLPSQNSNDSSMNNITKSETNNELLLDQYIKSANSDWQTFTDSPRNENLVTNAKNTDGYITVQNLDLLTKPRSNYNQDYVQQYDLEKLSKNVPTLSTVNTGYVASDELTNISKIKSSHVNQNLNNLNMLENSKCEGTQSGVGNGATGVISGYVTQHDLNIFAHHQQQQL
uniref:Fibronectin type-III domain-containing protein n=1 Tax=Glossina pallidipes TaxID=7398 RepID=A0A1B0A054_GLOPL